MIACARCSARCCTVGLVNAVGRKQKSNASDVAPDHARHLLRIKLHSRGSIARVSRKTGVAYYRTDVGEVIRSISNAPKNNHSSANM